MKKCMQLAYVRLLEQKLKAAPPNECAKLTKELVKVKDEWLNG